MGTAPPSKPVSYSAQAPSRPFAHHHSKCLRHKLLLSKPQSTLQTLIWRQDWQRVLIRLHLYPQEVRERLEIHVYDMDLQVYPLHLICALDPPAAVVQLCTQIFPDAAALPLRVLKSPVGRKIFVKKAHWMHLRRSFKAWRSRRRGAFPVDEDDLSASVEQRQLLLPFVEDMDPANDEASVWSRAESSCSSSSSNSNSSKSSLSSNRSLTGAKNVILQLSPSGGLAPLPVNTSNETDSTSATSKTSFYRVKWDLKPLWKEVAERGMLLPLHIACLFQASPDVLETLVQVYSLAALSDVLGMLPIHWVAAGWTLAPVQPPPASPVPRDPKPGPMPALLVLRRSLPESIHIRSGNHGMLAADYIQECMEDSDYKQLCFKVLSDGIDYMVEYGSFVSGDTIVFCDTDETSSYPSLRLFAGLSGLILDEDWPEAVAVVEEDATSARKWYYGVDTETVGASVWKRLPIHLACANGATLSLIDLLLKVFPESAVVEDPHDGALPLHIACRANATLPVIRRLVEECPEVVLAVDGGGRVPLHVAVISQAPYQVIEYLLHQDLESVVALDQNGRTPMDYAMEIDPSSAVVELMTMFLLRLERP